MTTQSAGERIHDAVFQCFKDAPPHLFHIISDLRLYIPESFMRSWFDYEMSLGYRADDRLKSEGNIVQYYMDVKVLPGYEKKVVLAHREASQNQGSLIRYTMIVSLF